MLFNPVVLLGHRGESLGYCSDLLHPRSDVAVGSEGEISPTQVREEVQKRQVMGGGRRDGLQEVLCLSPGGCECPSFWWLGALQPLSWQGELDGAQCQCSWEGGV